MHSCVLDQRQGYDGAQGKTCQEQVVIVQSQNDKGPEQPLWRVMTEACWKGTSNVSRELLQGFMCGQMCVQCGLWGDDKNLMWGQNSRDYAARSFRDSVLDDKLPNLLRYKLKVCVDVTTIAVIGSTHWRSRTGKGRKWKAFWKQALGLVLPWKDIDLGMCEKPAWITWHFIWPFLKVESNPVPCWATCSSSESHENEMSLMSLLFRIRTDNAAYLAE